MKIIKGFDPDTSKETTDKGHDEECNCNPWEWEVGCYWMTQGGGFVVVGKDAGTEYFRAYGNSVTELMAWAGVEIQRFRWDAQERCDQPECIHVDEICQKCKGLLPWRGDAEERAGGPEQCTCYLPVADALSHHEGTAQARWEHRVPVGEGRSERVGWDTSPVAALALHVKGAWAYRLQGTDSYNPGTRYALYHPNGAYMMEVAVRDLCAACGQTLPH